MYHSAQYRLFLEQFCRSEDPINTVTHSIKGQWLVKEVKGQAHQTQNVKYRV